MSFLTINAVEISTMVKSAGREPEEIGDMARALDGTLVSTRVKIKRKWPCETAMMTRAEADALEGLLLGRGHTWKFTAKYSAKGLTESATSGSVTYNGASGKFDKRVTLGAAAYSRWTPTGDDSLVAGAMNPKGDYTLMIWKLTSTGPDVWTHYIVRYLDGVTNKWVNGASNDAATTDFITNTAGVVQIGNGTDAAVFSDMVALPFGIPTTWIANIYANTRAFASAPKLDASGDLISNPTTPLSVRARNVRQKPEPYASDVVGKRIEFELHEA